MMVQLSYMNRRGAGVLESLPGPEAVERIKKLRCEASIRVPGIPERVGGVDPIDGADDRRVRWNWWFDQMILKEDVSK